MNTQTENPQRLQHRLICRFAGASSFRARFSYNLVGMCRCEVGRPLSSPLGLTKHVPSAGSSPWAPSSPYFGIFRHPGALNSVCVRRISKGLSRAPRARLGNPATISPLVRFCHTDATSIRVLDPMQLTPSTIPCNKPPCLSTAHCTDLKHHVNEGSFVQRAAAWLTLSARTCTDAIASGPACCLPSPLSFPICPRPSWP